MESVDDLARFYLRFIEVTGLSKVRLLGDSIGGGTAAEMATMRPEAPERLGLVAPTGLKPEADEILDTSTDRADGRERHPGRDTALTVPGRAGA